MAINVNTVYKTVLLILNKEQRGYITPSEFNRTATQVQLDVFDQYFDDLNQQLRVPQADYDYSDRQMSIDENISPFKTGGLCVYENGRFNLPILDNEGNEILNSGVEPSIPTQLSFYRIGTPVYTSDYGSQVEIQRLQRNDFYNIQKSPLTASVKAFPTYLYESNKLTVRPSTITTNVSTSFIRKPRNVVWGFTVGSLGQYTYDPAEGVSTQFELNASEQVNVITRILFYSGVIIRDPQVIQVAAQQIQQEEINKKS